MLCAAPPEVTSIIPIFFTMSLFLAFNPFFYIYDECFQDAKKFKLGDPRSFHYLNQTNCYEVANIDDGREYLETRSAMDVVGINNDEQVYFFLLNGLNRDKTLIK